MPVRGILHSLRPRVTWVPGALFILTAVACLPNGIIKRDFDRNAAPQFVSLCVTGIVLAVLFIIWKSRTQIPALVQIGVGGLLVATLISLTTGHNVINGLTGDSGRYTGLVSLYVLIIIALFFAQLGDDQFGDVWRWMIAGILIVEILGLIQSWGWITMPGDGGIGSTLGNLDFLSAWLGTSFPLLFWKGVKSRTRAIGIGLVFLLSLWLMIKIGAKQGVLDFIVLIPMVLIYLVRNRLKGLGFSVRVWSGFGIILAILWAEVIYLVPMAKLPVPGVAGDPNVRIRADFWYAGFGQFIHHLWLGVGPDNYGNYYEKYRSLTSVKLTETVLSNDAHSAVVQSFATLGIFGVIFFLVLLAALVRNLVVLVNDAERRWRGAVASVFCFVFLTNAAISPITLPNKFMFWAVAGYVIGAGQRVSPMRLPRFTHGPRIVGAALAIVVAFVGANFAIADTKFVEPGKHYSFSPYLPCVIYFPQQLSLLAANPQSAIAASKREVQNNPRCLEAESFLANAYLQQNNLPAARTPIYEMLDIAPGRQEVVRLAAIYALRAKDGYLQRALVSQGLKLGVLTKG